MTAALTSSRRSTLSPTGTTIARLSCLRLAAAAAGIGLALLGLLVSGKAMVEECPLSAPQVLKDMQSGVAGETGNVWTIAPDCSFTVARQVGLNVLQPHKQGQLTAHQRLQLKEMMDRMTATALPDQLGGPQVNARRITLAYGGKQSVLTLPPGGGDLKSLRAAAGDDSTRLMLDLADNLKSMTGG